MNGARTRGGRTEATGGGGTEKGDLLLRVAAGPGGGGTRGRAERIAMGIGPAVPDSCEPFRTILTPSDLITAGRKLAV